MTTDEYLVNLHQNAADAFHLARERLRISAERRKRTYDINVKEEKFSVGDWVYYNYPRRYKSRSVKWQKSYIGPYLIVRKLGPVNCVLQKSFKTKPFVVHVDKLKRCYGETPDSWIQVNSPSVA